MSMPSWSKAAESSAFVRKDGVTLGESIRVILSERLMAGEYAPGEKLSLRSLADALGVSMTPVREAVSRLVADHALEVAPNRAVRVPVLNVAKFLELTALRMDIEGMAAYRAAFARDEHDLALMSWLECEYSCEGQKARPNLDKAMVANHKLHFAIYRASKSPMLVDIIAGLWLKAGPILNIDMRASPDRLKSGHAVRSHAAAVAAMRRQDGEAARAAIAEDILIASKFIIGRGVLPA